MLSLYPQCHNRFAVTQIHTQQHGKSNTVTTKDVFPQEAVLAQRTCSISTMQNMFIIDRTEHVFCGPYRTCSLWTIQNMLSLPLSLSLYIYGPDRTCSQGLLEVVKRIFTVCITQTDPRFQNQVNFCIGFAGGFETGTYSLNHTNKSPFSKSNEMCIGFAGASEKRIYSMNHTNKSLFSESSEF